VLVVQAAEAPEASALELDAMSDNRLLTSALAHSGQLTGLGWALRKTSWSNRAPHSLHSYS
jgi:hypothetical protein